MFLLLFLYPVFSKMLLRHKICPAKQRCRGEVPAHKPPLFGKWANRANDPETHTFSYKAIDDFACICYDRIGIQSETER